MARVTIEDCVSEVANRFRLVMCGAQRGRDLASGVEPTVERVIKHEKNAVIALREIAQGNLDLEVLEEAIVRSHRRFSLIDPASEEDADGDERGGARFPAAERTELERTKAGGTEAGGTEAERTKAERTKAGGTKAGGTKAGVAGTLKVGGEVFGESAHEILPDSHAEVVSEGEAGGKTDTEGETGEVFGESAHEVLPEIHAEIVSEGEAGSETDTEGEAGGKEGG